ncbi:TetR/AcrR family transcriptional regulator [Aneurinibacillus sp. Ricciae_BoGa-3]|uniref:TetR/AcrR family transcriptional regulator n=1 Tax=Aneurinibacillus sp. Ricciae_BoGa-3 TaxID=3022697 RepID=UPI00234139CC|nr:TetR/AcrR family transcriptional regulator [Aneurinibacillus sp. Ricciae_BoGa-3]WCK56243.1 TetR/AcrR family transcriptional regulator [Aneurinibacillus sp. Ricciae_BoGa-3]
MVNEEVRLSTRQRILNASIKLFEEKGYHGVSVDEIIEESGSSKGGFYHNFKSKEELLFTIHDQYIKDTLTQGYECYKREGTPIERLTAMIRDLLIGIDKYKSSVTVFFQDYRYLTGNNYKIVEKKRDEYVEIMLNILEQGIDSKEIRSELPAKILAMAIFGMIDWTYIWYRKEGKYSIEQIADIFVDLIINSILTNDLKDKEIYASFFLKNKI